MDGRGEYRADASALPHNVVPIRPGIELNFPDRRPHRHVPRCSAVPVSGRQTVTFQRGLIDDPHAVGEVLSWLADIPGPVIEARYAALMRLRGLPPLPPGEAPEWSLGLADGWMFRVLFETKMGPTVLLTTDLFDALGAKASPAMLAALHSTEDLKPHLRGRRGALFVASPVYPQDGVRVVGFDAVAPERHDHPMVFDPAMVSPDGGDPFRSLRYADDTEAVVASLDAAAVYRLQSLGDIRQIYVALIVSPG